ncbi:MAG: hypothetical protein KKI12_04315 [Proteobacteria bacterium]|nr:hypothetical protein [Pseudomonadota bacterium]MBU4260178.1 hypothetical protein [Pseudomonadota bacterium]MBU4287379.1 hypothetical protein [Pseudomonadota bacterium]
MKSTDKAMPSEPQFKYYLQHKKNLLSKNSNIWSLPLPMNRKKSQKADGISVTYGDYFYAIRSFLEKDEFKSITSAISQQLNQNIKPEEIKEIRIYLEKHGEFYHPARIETYINRSRILFVLNVAISNTGKNYIKKEFEILNKLNNEFSFSFIPKVYSQGKIGIKNKDFEISMFLGEWFEGFNEFHISQNKHKQDKTDSSIKIVVWDHEKGNFFLSPDETLELYSRVAMILTCYYNAETFEQIFPWHHAAGDFVIKLQNNNMELKLITVRQYASMFRHTSGTEKNNKDSTVYFMLEGMLVFFLNLSIRNRLDRLDGVGEIVWSDNIAVEGTLKGFLKGLSKISSKNLIPDALATDFINYISCFTKTDLLELCNSIVNTYNPMAPEISVIRQNLKNHVDILFSTIKNL